MNEEPLIHVFRNNKVCLLGRSPKHSKTAFGGPFDLEVTGPTTSLHMIAMLCPQHLEVLSLPPGVCVPLVFGMTYSGCNLSYLVESESRIAIRNIEPASPEPDFPYRTYPLVLPYAPLAVTSCSDVSYGEFAQAICSNLPPSQPSDVLVVIPPPSTLGISLWGRCGDAENVCIVFEWEPDEGKVTAYTVCS
jgi:hypothetical protein